MLEAPEKIAAQCRHYAMCKIDYLNTGLCPSAAQKPYVAYYPQGRMDIYDALVNDRLPVTEGLLDIVETCTLCGICDKQCHFVTGMTPSRVMKALKHDLSDYLNEGREVSRPAEDPILTALQAIVGKTWATNDPAVLMAYSNDPFPLKDEKIPRYVVLPDSTEEVAAIVKLAHTQDIPYIVRGNGGSVYGMVFSEGMVLDMNRMKTIEVDPENWTATVGAGVTSFELQQEAAKHGCRINAAEPAATVCGNILCTGIFSPWSAAYGTAADNFVDMEFVNDTGRIFSLNDVNAPNLYAYTHEVKDVPGVCTRAKIKLHPVSGDEEGVLIPFEDFAEAVRFARELNLRRIGSAVAVLGTHYLATFMSPSQELADRLKTEMDRVLGIRYAVFVVADAYQQANIRQMADAVIDSQLLRTIMLGLPRLLNKEWLELVQGFESHNLPYNILCDPELRPLLETVLRPSPRTIAAAVDPEMRDFYEALYTRPEYTDMAWLNAFRIISARMSRHKHVIAFLIYVPLNNIDLITRLNEEFRRIAEKHGIDNAYGFLTPMDLGKRAILEYDYYIDHTNPTEKEKTGRAMAEIIPWLDDLAMTISGFTWIKTFFSQGCARKESFFYRGFRERIKLPASP